MIFDENIFYGKLIQCDLPGAIEYVKQFPEQSERYGKYQDVFEKAHYLTYDVSDELNQILTFYQRYYRDVLYCKIHVERAQKTLTHDLAAFFEADDLCSDLSALESNQVAKAFLREGFHFLGGRTGGYFGPYVWQTTEDRTYEVELPDGVQEYTVRLLDGFICKSWLDYISFGEVSPGGWTDGDGIIHCIKSSYDVTDESFTVSLLKHEAQHAVDLNNYKDMSSEDLEYRAKLVELIYSCKRNLLSQFLQQADPSRPDNGHAMAAYRIANDFANATRRTQEELATLSIREVQAIASGLFQKSNDILSSKHLS